jgi:hypothetical protein
VEDTGEKFAVRRFLFGRRAGRRPVIEARLDQRKLTLNLTDQQLVDMGISSGEIVSPDRSVMDRRWPMFRAAATTRSVPQSVLVVRPR